MRDTQITGRMGALWEGFEKIADAATQAGRERYWRALAGNITEDEVAELERGDLCDSQVISTLDVAYEHLDPTNVDTDSRRTNAGWLGTNAELETLVASVRRG